MQCYTELVPPTAVNASISLPFLSPTANNLIVAKRSLLQIFAPKSIVTDASTEQSGQQVNGHGPIKGEKKERIHTTKLVLISQIHVSGTITDLARVKALRSKSGGELLLVALKDAKLSLVEWDPEKHNVSTVSIHYYEREDLQGAPWAPSLGQCTNCLTVDASSRCAAFKFGFRNIAILPFHQAGDDLAMEDLDMDGDARPVGRNSIKPNGETPATATPYASSFVLSLLALDPALKFPVHLAFLQGYREPTLAILSSTIAPSASLLHERRDPINLTVYTLDLEQRASTTLLSVTGLPYDLFQIIPLPGPIGGSLLLGYNEIIHVDQAGKANGVAANDFAKQCTSFPLVQQSDLDLKLEGCVVEQLNSGSGEMLICLSTGELAVLSFKLDGRTVAGLVLHKVGSLQGGSLMTAGASCAAIVGRGRLFVGSEDSDSVILGWSSKLSKPTKQRVKAENGDADEDMDFDLDMEVEDENDLYAETEPATKTSTTSPTQSVDDYVFRIHDRLTNIAPLRDVRAIKSRSTAQQGGKTIAEGSTDPRLDLYATTGRGSNSSLVHLSPEIRLQAIQSLEAAEVRRVWSLFAEPKDEGTSSRAKEIHNVFVTSTATYADPSESRAYRFENGKLQEFDSSDFEVDAGASIEIATFLGGTRIVQVLIGEVRMFDAEFNLTQILPLSDDSSVTASYVPASATTETPVGIRQTSPVSPPHIIAASIAEPFVLLVRDDGSVVVLKADESGDLEELDKGDHLSQGKWISGSLYDDVNDAFHLESVAEDDDEEYSSMLMFLLDQDGGLQIFRLPRLQDPIYKAPGLGFLPAYLSTTFNVRRASARGYLTEMLVAELGDATYKSPHLVLRSTSDDLIIYSPYQDTSKGAATKSLQFRKIPHPYLPKAPPAEQTDTTKSKAPLRLINDPQGNACVIAPGSSTCAVVKSASNDPVILSTRPGVLQSISPHVSEHGNGIACVDESGKIQILQLSRDADYSSGWVCEKILTGSRISGFDYHDRTDRFVIAVSVDQPFRLPDDELHPEWTSETATFLPTMEQDSVKLVDATTLNVTDTLELDSQEVVMCIKTMSLEISEHTHEKKSLVCIGTAITRGEDINTFGCIYVVDIIDVVPEPDRPETGRKFKVLSKVRDKGAVTAIAQIGTEGFLLVAHGQKCFVRGLKEDGTLLPVAFIDTQCYVNVAKELPRTGLTMLGDALKGIWFIGYTEDPYHLKLFGKAVNDLEVVAAEYLPDEKSLYIIVLDAEGVLHVFQYDPANPKSLAGHNLLHLDSMNSGTFPSGMTRLPRTQTLWERLSEDSEDIMDTDSPAQGAYQVLVHGDDGSLSLLTPLSSNKYRALGALQSYLNTALPHPLGLNPKAYRNIDADLSVGGRAILDGNVLRRWMELGTWKRAESVMRAGLDAEWELRALLDGIGGRGLGYL